MDAYSWKCLGWTLSGSLGCEELTLSALKRAFQTRGFSKTEGPEIHHSDQGSQYAAWLYTDCLRTHQTQMRNDRPKREEGRVGNPYENARMESFFKTLKTEEVYLYEYQTPREAKERIAQFITTYNTRRLHSALGYRPPDEFEREKRESP